MVVVVVVVLAVVGRYLLVKSSPLMAFDFIPAASNVLIVKDPSLEHSNCIPLHLWLVMCLLYCFLYDVHICSYFLIYLIYDACV